MARVAAASIFAASRCTAKPRRKNGEGCMQRPTALVMLWLHRVGNSVRQLPASVTLRLFHFWVGQLGTAVRSGSRERRVESSVAVHGSPLKKRMLVPTGFLPG